MRKSQMTLNIRISSDSTGNQKYTKDDIIFEIINENINFVKQLLVRKTDGVIMGEVIITNNYICAECGLAFLSDVQKSENRISTYHIGECTICKEIKNVTHIRIYNYLEKSVDI